jgi:dGTPase
VGCKKNGFFEAEHKYFADVAENTGLQPIGNSGRAWFRHPLAFLTEAADDICYIIADLEDGFEVKKVTISEVEELLMPIAQASSSDLTSLTPKQRVGKLRASSIGNLIQEVSEIFVNHESEILAGTFGSHGETLLSKSKHKPILDAAKTITAERVFNSDLVLPVEISGFQVIGGLLGFMLRLYRSWLKLALILENMTRDQRR